MTQFLVQETSLIQVADAIREKAGTTEEILFPDGFVEAVQNIQTGIELPTLENQGSTSPSRT